MMTFHESYGTLPARILKVVRQYNVSPADWDMIIGAVGEDWNEVNAFILDNSTRGYFQYPFGF